MASPATKATVARLYRRSLKLSLDWAVHRYIWRPQAVYIRSLFDANKHVSEPRQQRELFEQTEALLDKWKHPEPFRPATAPGGSKFERNMPAPILDRLNVSPAGMNAGLILLLVKGNETGVNIDEQALTTVAKAWI